MRLLTALFAIIITFLPLKVALSQELNTQKDKNIEIAANITDKDDRKIKLRLEVLTPQKEKDTLPTIENYLEPRGCPDYWTRYGNEPHELYLYKYNGLYGVFKSQLERLAMRYYNQGFDIYQYNQDNPYLFWDKVNKIYGDFGEKNCWWTRDLLDLRSLDRGGLRVSVQEIGQEFDALRIGDFSYTNGGKLLIEDFTVDVGAQTTKKESSNGKTTYDEAKPIFSFGFIKSILHNKYTIITENIKLNARLDQFNSTNASGIGSNLKIMCLYHEKPFTSFQFGGEIRPFINEYSAELSIQFLFF